MCWFPFDHSISNELHWHCTVCTVYFVLHCYSIAHTHISSHWMGGCFGVWCACIHCLLLKTISISTRTSVWPMVKRSENLKFITNHLFVLCVALYRPCISRSYTVQIKSIYECGTRALRTTHSTDEPLFDTPVCLLMIIIFPCAFCVCVVCTQYTFIECAIRSTFTNKYHIEFHKSWCDIFHNFCAKHIKQNTNSRRAIHFMG